jgi:hypothetical protein
LRCCCRLPARASTCSMITRIVGRTFARLVRNEGAGA